MDDSILDSNMSLSEFTSLNKRPYQHINSFISTKVNEMVRENKDIDSGDPFTFTVTRLIDDVGEFLNDNPEVARQSTVNQIVTDILYITTRRIIGHLVPTSVVFQVTGKINRWELVFTRDRNIFTDIDKMNTGIIFIVDEKENSESELKILDNLIIKMNNLDEIIRFVTDRDGRPLGVNIDISSRMADYFIMQDIGEVIVPDSFSAYLKIVEEARFLHDTINEPTDPVIKKAVDSKTKEELDTNVSNIYSIMDKKEDDLMDVNKMSPHDKLIFKTMEDADRDFVKLVVEASGVLLSELAKKFGIKEIADSDLEYRKLVNSLSTTINVLKEIKTGASNLLDIQDKYKELSNK